ncbi:MAG: uracil-DNA glycosylase [Candidatus Lambdaproteobacteria bacterium]|nr:uracil-DNA glycosylase [Candidatus Lambdaproteobacteria bacterium]
MARRQTEWEAHLARLTGCTRCAGVQGPPVVGAVAGARIYLMGQAPGPRERELGRPFAWSAGKTLFRWFATVGVDEAHFRAAVYMGAVIRCFPGKSPGKQGDRKPGRSEVLACRDHFEAEFRLLRPALVVPVGRLAIEQFLPCPRLDAVVGQSFPLTRQGHAFTGIPLPHPSGLSRWLQSQAGKRLLGQALELIARHPAWVATFGNRV